MTYPKYNEIKDLLEEFEEQEPTLVIDYENSSKSDVLKYRLCQEFVKVLKEENISQAQLAKKLNVDKAIVSKIINHKIESFTVDRLIDLFSTIRSIEVFLKAS